MQRTLKICLAAILLAGTASAIEVEKRGRGGRGGGRGGRGRKVSCETSRDRTIERLTEDCADAADVDACTALVTALADDTDFANCDAFEAAQEAYKTEREALTDDEEAAIEAAKEAAEPDREAAVEAAKTQYETDTATQRAALEDALEDAKDAFRAAVDAESPDDLVAARTALDDLKDAYELAVACTKCQIDGTTCDTACL